MTNTDSQIDSTDSYPLDDAILELLNQTLRQMDAIKAFREGALMLFMMQHKLGPGDWRLAENAKELVRAMVQPPKQTEPPSDLEQQLAESIKNM